LLSKMLSLAAVWGVRTDAVNPAQLVQKYRERSRERFLSSVELRRLGEVLAKAEKESAEPWQAGTAVWLLLLTGARKSESLSLRWEYIDCENGVILLPESKTGRKTIYLTTPVMAVLSKLPWNDGHGWVLPAARGARKNRHFEGIGHIW